MFKLGFFLLCQYIVVVWYTYHCIGLQIMHGSSIGNRIRIFLIFIVCQLADLTRK